MKKKQIFIDFFFGLHGLYWIILLFFPTIYFIIGGMILICSSTFLICFLGNNANKLAAPGEFKLFDFFLVVLK